VLKLEAADFEMQVCNKRCILVLQVAVHAKWNGPLHKIYHTNSIDGIFKVSTEQGIKKEHTVQTIKILV
jgi:hypothetical protein